MMRTTTLLLVPALLALLACQRAPTERPSTNGSVAAAVDTGVEARAPVEVAERERAPEPEQPERDAPASEETVHLPDGYAAEPIRTIVGLHGMNANPHVLRARADRLANRYNVAIVEVSATVPRGLDRYIWSGDIEADHARVVEGLERVSDRINIAEGCVPLYGFSQGGITAFNLVLTYPDDYCSAFVMSPGGFAPVAPDPADISRLADRSFVVTVGANERDRIVALSESVRDAAEALGANVDYHVDDTMVGHRLHRDVERLLGAWIPQSLAR